MRPLWGPDALLRHQLCRCYVRSGPDRNDCAYVAPPFPTLELPKRPILGQTPAVELPLGPLPRRTPSTSAPTPTGADRFLTTDYLQFTEAVERFSLADWLSAQQDEPACKTVIRYIRLVLPATLPSYFVRANLWRNRPSLRDIRELAD